MEETKGGQTNEIKLNDLKDVAPPSVSSEGQ